MDTEINPPDGYFARTYSNTQPASLGTPKEPAPNSLSTNKISLAQSNKEQASNQLWEAWFSLLGISTISKYSSIKDN